jgi:predicted dehydrogenase
MVRVSAGDPLRVGVIGVGWAGAQHVAAYGALAGVEVCAIAGLEDGDEFGATLYGTEGGAELIVEDYAPSGALTIFGDDAGAPVTTRVRARPGRGHAAVVEQFVAKIRSGRWQEHDGAGAIELARVVDACYRSAAERREIAVGVAAGGFSRDPRPG